MKFLHRVNNSTWDIFMDCIYYSRPFLLSPNQTGTATAKKDTVSGWDIDFKFHIRSQLFISSHSNFGAYTILCNFYRFKNIKERLLNVDVCQYFRDVSLKNKFQQDEAPFRKFFSKWNVLLYLIGKLLQNKI